jgi:hypothetical protein
MTMLFRCFLFLIIRYLYIFSNIFFFFCLPKKRTKKGPSFRQCQRPAGIALFLTGLGSFFATACYTLPVKIGAPDEKSGPSPSVGHASRSARIRLGHLGLWESDDYCYTFPINILHKLLLRRWFTRIIDRFLPFVLIF